MWCIDEVYHIYAFTLNMSWTPQNDPISNGPGVATGQLAALTSSYESKRMVNENGVEAESCVIPANQGSV